MAKTFVIAVFILVLMMMWAEGDFSDEIYPTETEPIIATSTNSTNDECELGSGSCEPSFYMKHQIEILVGIGVGVLLLAGCCCYCCCCKEGLVIHMKIRRWSRR